MVHRSAGDRAALGCAELYIDRDRHRDRKASSSRLLPTKMTTYDAISVLVPALVLAIVWYKIGRSTSRNYYRGYLRGYDLGYDEGVKDGFAEGRIAKDQIWWDDAEKEIDQERRTLWRKGKTALQNSLQARN